MSRKRSREIKHKVVEKPKKVYTETFKPKRNFYVVVALVSIFCLVLFMNAYFNYTTGVAFNPEGETLGTRFFLSGPDPYYNMRSITESIDGGYYRFVTEYDPLLNYPIGHYGSSRPPLFNMIAIGSASVLGNFMEPIDALGWSMLFLPAIYGALLIFPVYGIGKEIFNKKVGLISAFFIAIIPIHIASGHGSALSLFDHDSFVFLLSTIIIYFMIKSFKAKDTTKSILYAILGGATIGALQLSWIAAQTVYIMIVAFLVIYLIFDLFKKRNNLQISLAGMVAFVTAFLVALPYQAIKGNIMDYMFFCMIFAVVLFVVHYIIKRIEFPWILTLPALMIFTGGALGVLWYIVNFIGRSAGALHSIGSIIFGEGVYGGQVSLTIGEANTFGISQTVMSFGPALYWFAMTGFVFFIYKTFLGKWKPENLFMIVMFFMLFWLTTTAGRFLNDLVPLLAVFAGFFTVVIVEKANFKTIGKNIRNLSGFRKIKAIKPLHLIVVFILAFILIMPNTLTALDAAVPPQHNEEILGFEGAHGLYLGTSYFWSDACYWLSQQDTEIEKPEDRHGVISWWDYGFYISSMAEHGTVASNYQEGIECAGNFLTSQTEKEAISILIIRVIEGEKLPKRATKGEISQAVKEVFETYFGNESQNIINIIEDPETYAPSYNQLVAPEYGNTELRIGAINAMYQDTQSILSKLDDFSLTQLYHSMMNVTGKSIRYFAIDGRDISSIFGVFPFLSHKGTHGFITMEDDFTITYYLDRNTGNYYTLEQLQNMTQAEVQKMDLDTRTEGKDGFYNSFIYRNYNGMKDNRLPCYMLNHWKLVYVSPSIAITKYYEGAIINGLIDFNGTEYNETSYVVLYDEYGVPHSVQGVNSAGQFQMISVPGNITIKYFANDTEVAETSFIVTEDEAMWKTDFVKEVYLEVNDEL